MVAYYKQNPRGAGGEGHTPKAEEGGSTNLGYRVKTLSGEGAGGKEKKDEGREGG